MSLAAVCVSAQELTVGDLREIQSSFVKDASTTALQNILKADPNLSKLSLNHDLDGKIDHFFKHKVNVNRPETVGQMLDVHLHERIEASGNG